MSAKERPILFSGPMVRAILRGEGPKTVTRRVVKPQPTNLAGPNFDGLWSDTIDPVVRYFSCPYGQPGDRLWVRETHGFAHRHVYFRADETFVSCDWFYTSPAILARFEKEEPGILEKFAVPKSYKDSDLKYQTGPKKWNPSIHMPRWASRIMLEVVSVRVERLQEITEEDAMAEGVVKIREGCYTIRGFDYDNAGLCHSEAVTPFMKLWMEINGEESWEANPWVWRVEFKRVMPV